jgi:putative transposase
MIDKKHALPITRQAKALKLSRGSVYSMPRPVPAADLTIMRHLDELHLEFPFAGSGILRDLLNAEGFETGRRHIATLMKRMAIEAIYRKRALSACLQRDRERHHRAFRRPLPRLVTGPNPCGVCS